MSKIEELLQESVKEIEIRKQALLNECEAIEKSIKDKENEANKRISQLEDASRKHIAESNKEADLKLEEAKKISKSLEGSEETLKSIANEFERLDAERKALKDEKASFEIYKTETAQQIDAKLKEIDLRETKLKEA